MSNLIIEFYCLPYRELLLLFGVLTYGFLVMDRRFRAKKFWKAVLVLASILWICVILLFTVSTRESGSTDSLFLTPFHSYREMQATGNIEILRSNFMNVILFYPGGMLAAALLPKKWPAWVRVVVVFLAFTGLSIGIESFQYAAAAGRAEIDDVIHNAAGALAGGIVTVIPFFNTQEERS